MARGSASFGEGNEFWRKRSSHGRNPIWSHPDELEKSIVEYFEYTEARTDWDKQHWVEGVEVAKHVRVPFTVTGLILFLGIHIDTWYEYKKRSAFTELCELTETTIRNQKFEGAISGHYNAAIIARDLGLADKVQVETIELSPEERARRIKEITDRLIGGNGQQL